MITPKCVIVGVIMCLRVRLFVNISVIVFHCARQLIFNTSKHWSLPWISCSEERLHCL